MQDIVTPEHMNRIEGNTKTLETDLTSGLSGKVDKVAGKGLSTLDFTTALRDKINTSETKITALESNKLNVTDYTKTSILSKLGTAEVNLNVSKLQGKSASDFLAVGGKAVDSAKLNGAVEKIGGVADSIAKRTSAGHLVAVKFQEGTQLLEAKYASKSTTDSHISSTNNPHSVTKAQVGLNFVENLPVADWQEIITGDERAYVTADELQQALSGLSVGSATSSSHAVSADTATIANNALKLNNYEASQLNTANTVAVRDSLGNISAKDFIEDGIKLSARYLGKGDTAVNSALLEGKSSSAFATSAQGVLADNAVPVADLMHIFKGKYLYMDDEDDITANTYRHLIMSNKSTPKNAWCVVLTYNYRVNSSSSASHIYQYAYALDGSFTAFRTYKSDIGWGSWSYIATRTLYGTASPPSSLLSGQIYVQY